MEAKEFDDLVRPFSDVKTTSDLVMIEDAMKMATINYDPSRNSGVFAGKNKSGMYINTFEKGPYVPEKGDAGPWVNFMEQLCPIEKDRIELMRWCATLIARPDIKMSYGVLIVSETQGVGKSTLGVNVLGKIVGQANLSEPTEAMLEDKFNSWAARKRLVVIHEIYSGHSNKIYNKLKSLFSEGTASIRQMNKDAYDIDNWAHVLACSNSTRALKMDNYDRRWFIPKVTNKKLPKKYWDNFFEWLEDQGGLNKIMYWAEEFLKKHPPVMKGERAPDTEAKRSMIEEGYSEGQREVIGFIEYVQENMKKASWMNIHMRPKGEGAEKWKPEGVTLYLNDLVQLIKDEIYDGRRPDHLEKPTTIRRLAEAKGFFSHDDKVWFNGRSGKLVCSEEWMLRVPGSDLIRRVKPLDVKAVVLEYKKM